MRLINYAANTLIPLADALFSRPDMSNFLCKSEVLNEQYKALVGEDKYAKVTCRVISNLSWELMKGGLDNGRVSINVTLPSASYNHIRDGIKNNWNLNKYRLFMDTVQMRHVKYIANKNRELGMVAYNRPPLVLNPDGDGSRYTLYFVKQSDNNYMVVGCIATYHNSLTSWADKAGLRKSAMNYSSQPSTHYLENPENFVWVKSF